MTPKEKAKELKDNFQKQVFFDVTDERLDINEAKGLALLAVDLLIECTPSMNIYPPNFQSKNPRVKEYWQEVKQEINKL